MPSDEVSAERKQTDESLRFERTRADVELSETQAALEEAADAVITRARARADEVLERARRRSDLAIAEGPIGVPARTAIVEERGRADAAVREERARADAILREERAELPGRLAAERSETDKDLMSERTQADSALATRDEFLAIVSHDLRNMLHSIMGFAGLIAEGGAGAGNPAPLIAHARRIQRSGGRMSRLIGDLVDVASIEAGALVVSLEVGDPTLLVIEAVDTLQQQATAGGLTLLADVIQPVPPIPFDPARILQVLMNLLSNALKFTPPGGTIVVRVERSGDDVLFSVTDTGIGIQEAHRGMVFERFLQVDKHDRRGVGLGLYISKCIIQGHGGRIGVRSELTKGSSFSFSLPCAPAATG